MNTSHAHELLSQEFVPVGIAVLVVSDSRTLETDSSGKLLEEGFWEAGHQVIERAIVPDEKEKIAQKVNAWVREEKVHCIVVTGGTGITPRDITPEAIEPLYDKPLLGFGELFRQLSFEEIGPACIQSRATAGIIRGRPVFVIPGSRGACCLALTSILLPQLDIRTKPCSFPGLWRTWGKPGERP